MGAGYIKDEKKLNRKSLSINPSIVKEGFGNKLCSYLIALEGYRRGLQLELHDSRFITFSLASKERTLFFNKSRIDSMVTKEAIEIVKDKEATKNYLRDNGIPVPEGRFFDSNATDQEILDYSEKLGYPVVLKPYNSSLGKGVISNIKDVTSLKEAINHVRYDLNKKGIILERFIKGEDFRIYVIRDRAVSVVKRIPANVTGNGIDTIEQLIEDKNIERKKNPYLSKGLIKLDHEVLNTIQTNGYTLDSILEEGKLLFLREKANASAGGDTIDVTETFPDRIKQLAIQAVRTIPDLYNAGVDVIFDEGNKENQGTVIELNARAQIGLHAYPSVGEGINVASYLLDTYFPETVKEDKYVVKREKLVFHLKSALKPLKEGSASSVKVKPAPRGETSTRDIKISGDIEYKEFKKYMRREVKQLALLGNMKLLDSGNIRIIIAGEPSNITEFRKRLNNSSFEVLKDREYNGLVKVGFEIR